MAEQQQFTMILHIAHKHDWERAAETGSYTVDTLQTEGFIHCSTAEQVVRIANLFYRGQHDLVLLFIDAKSLEAPIRYEPPAEDPASAERFPHIYGPINVDAVLWALPFAPDEHGHFWLP
jgi:uncharacterized protein (DUF952 family)